MKEELLIIRTLIPPFALLGWCIVLCTIFILAIMNNKKENKK